MQTDMEAIAPSTAEYFMSTKHNLKALSPYEPLFTELKLSIKRAQVKAGMAINRDLVLLYWQIGKAILNQKKEGTKEGTWDSELLDRVASNLQSEFPDVSGFSKRNLKYMQAFAALYSDYLMVQAGPALITWEHNCILIDRVKDADEKHWYMQQIIANGWNSEILNAKIDSKAYRAHRDQDRAGAGFANNMTQPPSELTQQMLLDSHNLEFLTLTPDTQKRYFQNTFVQEVKEFFAANGRDLATVGTQYQLIFNDQDYFVDFLFYHLRLRCFILVNLETEEYCTAQLKDMCEQLHIVNETMKHPTDSFSIGIILSRTPRTRTAKYILREEFSPHTIVQIDKHSELPASLQSNLHSLEPLLKVQ